MLNLTSVLTVLGTLTLIVTAFFALRRFVHWWRPIRICSNIRLIFDGSGPDQIGATITNVSSEDQVLVQCSARSVYQIRTALLRHLKRPFTPPRLYPTIWYAPFTFELMGREAIRLAPKERRRLSHSLSDHPLSLFVTPEIKVEAQLSDRRIFRSRRITVPDRWRFNPKTRRHA